jgi:hypothetical protein
MWVNRVTRLVPGTTPEDGRRFAALLGLRREHSDGVCDRFAGELGEARFGRDNRFALNAGGLRELFLLTNPKLKELENEQRLTTVEATELARQWMRDRGVLPPNYDSKSFESMWISGMGVRYLFNAVHHGLLHGYPCRGPGQRIEYQVLMTRELYTLTYEWTESVPLGVVECKTVKEGMDALNRGRAGHLRRELWGGRCVFYGSIYYAEGVGATHVQPCFVFQIRKAMAGDGKGMDWDIYYVPMAKAKYFKDPRRQVTFTKQIR